MSDIYLCAALALDALAQRSTSIHAVCAAVLAAHGAATAGAPATRRPVDARRLTALVANTLSFRKPLTAILASAKTLQLEAAAFRIAPPRTHASAKGKERQAEGDADTPTPAVPTPQSLALVLLHDILLSSTRPSASVNWPPRAALERHLTRLKSELARLRAKAGAASLEELRDPEERRQRTLAARCPRWVRVNGRRMARAQAVELLVQQGWSEMHAEVLPKGKHFLVTPHLPDVLAFAGSSTSQLLAHPLYQDGTFILQDLASCFPASVLLAQDVAAPLIRDGEPLHVIDATAAPGNKTGHLSALLARSGAHVSSKVSAFELAPNRFRTLVSQLSRAGALSPGSAHLLKGGPGRGKPPQDAAAKLAGAVSPRLADFLATDPLDDEWQDVRGMLLDPSCSGSGIVGRMEVVDAEQEEEASPEETQATRLASLAAFQLSMIDHALQFPNLRRLVYSTCSIHPEENERVAIAALALPRAVAGGWRLAPRSEVVPTWPGRGRPEECGGNTAHAEGMIRCDPGGSVDVAPGEVHIGATNGFFVACFVRGEPGDTASDDVAEPALAGKRKRNKEKKLKQKKRKREEAQAASATDEQAAPEVKTKRRALA